jgi:hypothetical protein
MSDGIDSKKIFFRTLAIIAALGIISLLLYQFVIAKATPARKNCEGTTIEMFRTQLALIPSSDTQQRINVEGKINAWETMIAICEKITPRTGIPDVTPKFIPSTPQPFPTGIFEGQTGDYHSFEAKIENHWQGIINGNRVIAFAGAWVNDPSQGFISVKIASNTGPAVWGYYPSTMKAGVLRILGINGSRLIIQQANDQQILYFDVPALTYVSSLAVTVVPVTPTSIITTPQPRATPYPVP